MIQDVIKLEVWITTAVIIAAAAYYQLDLLRTRYKELKEQ